jgi:hypothetical protein
VIVLDGYNNRGRCGDGEKVTKFTMEMSRGLGWTRWRRSDEQICGDDNVGMGDDVFLTCLVHFRDLGNVS